VEDEGCGGEEISFNYRMYFLENIAMKAARMKVPKMATIPARNHGRPDFGWKSPYPRVVIVRIKNLFQCYLYRSRMWFTSTTTCHTNATQTPAANI
jgi:hypothetical protein